MLLFPLDIMVKPDGVQRRLVGNVISRFERKGLLLRAMKMMTPSRKLLEEHYQHLREMGFFNKLVDHMASGPVVAMVRLVLALLIRTLLNDA